MSIWFEGLTLPVSDLDTSIQFYESLGFVTEIRVERFALLRYGSGTLGLLPAGPRLDIDAAGGTHPAGHDTLLTRRFPPGVEANQRTRGVLAGPRGRPP